MGRKNPGSIVERIYAELFKNGAKSTNEIALAINSNTKTVKNYIKLIELIQQKPPIIVERTRNITVVRVEKK